MVRFTWKGVLKPSEFVKDRTVEVHDRKGDVSEQQSQKRGLRSEAMKETAARNPYETIPPAQPVGGAFGEQQQERETDHDLAFKLQEKQSRREQEDDSQN